MISLCGSWIWGKFWSQRRWQSCWQRNFVGLGQPRLSNWWSRWSRWSSQEALVLVSRRTQRQCLATSQFSMPNPEQLASARLCETSASNTSIFLPIVRSRIGNIVNKLWGNYEQVMKKFHKLASIQNHAKHCKARLVCWGDGQGLAQGRRLTAK